MAEIPVLRSVLTANEKVAGRVRRRLAKAGVLAFNLIGSPGAGKTALLEQTIPRLKRRLRVAVIEADCATTRDAQRIHALGVEVVQINTGKGCHAPAHLVFQALRELTLNETDLLFIENVGNLVCPTELDIGETAKLAVLSVTEGDDKPQKYPMLFRQCKAVVLNKTDLIPHTDFRLKSFEKDLRAINREVPVFRVSCTTGEGIEAWVKWLRDYCQAARAPKKTRFGVRKSPTPTK